MLGLCSRCGSLGSLLSFGSLSLDRFTSRSGLSSSLVGLLGGSLGSTGFGLVAVRRGPEGEIVTEQLHDQGAVAIGFLGERIELGNGIIKSLLGEVACSVRRVEDLVVEHREIESKSKTDGVSWGELRLRNIGGTLWPSQYYWLLLRDVLAIMFTL
jgi:hypothetical protein